MTVQAWLDPLYDAAGMSAADRWAIEEAGVPSLELMETAGRGLADLAIGLARPGVVTVVCGKGNNGGDGLVAAHIIARPHQEVEPALVATGARRRL